MSLELFIMVPRDRIELPTRGFSGQNFESLKNVVITRSWFYSDFLWYFWFGLEPFGNIWTWRAQSVL